jgi:tetraacyldisaccharide 4'-kinase
MVEWLARWFHEHGVRVALVSRGYAAQSGQNNDEAEELHQKLPDVPHLLNPRRVVAAREAIETRGAQLIILDDGFQHRRLARDLDLVLVDAIEPFGFEHIFPRGMLREPLSGFARADVIGLTRSDAIDESTRRAIQDRVRTYNPDALWLELSHAPRCLRNCDGDLPPIEQLRDKRLLAFCGLGNPAGFRHALATCGFHIDGFREFPDHHLYGPDDLNRLAEWADRAKADALICTHKDLVKIGKRNLGKRPLWALEIGLAILHGEAEFVRRLEMLASLAESGRSTTSASRS